MGTDFNAAAYGGNEMAYDVDIVMCIDATGSMSPVIEDVKNNALDFGTTLNEALDLAQKTVGQLRIKVIVFRDLNSGEPITETKFFVLPDENAEFESEVKSIHATGGGDEPESALDAIVKAWKSDWCTTGWKRRHVTVLFTDASSHPLDEGEHIPDAPADLKTLQEWWNNGVPGSNMEKEARRLVLFAPDAYPWNLMRAWDLVEGEPSNAGSGCSEIGMNTIIDKLVKSVSAVAVQ